MSNLETSSGLDISKCLVAGINLKNNERVVLFKLLFVDLSWTVNIVIRVFVGFGLNILKINSYTFTFEIFGYSGFFFW